VNRRTLLIGVAAALAVLVLWYLVLWSPRGKAIDKAKSRQQIAADQVDELQARLNQLRDAQRNEAATRAQIAQLQEAIPDEPNLAQFILDANDAANRSGIDFLSISPTPPAASTSAPVVPATPGANGAAAPVPSQIALGLNITGGYFQVLDFINRLTDLTRIVVIDGLNVSGGTGGDLSVQLTGRMFTNQPPAGTAPVPGTPGATTTTTVVGGATGATTTTVPGATTTTAVAQ
jgi:Tfp pilus assembly protein PilO